MHKLNYKSYIKNFKKNYHNDMSTIILVNFFKKKIGYHSFVN